MVTSGLQSVMRYHVKTIFKQEKKTKTRVTLMNNSKKLQNDITRKKNYDRHIVYLIVLFPLKIN